MHYLEAPPRKFLTVAFAGGVLGLLVFSTFALKDAHFGGVRLPNAIGRVVLQAADEAYYHLRFGGESLVASAAASIWGGSGNAYENRAARAVPTLLYHNLKNGWGDYAVSKESFAAQMKALYDAGWRTITLEEFESFMRGERTLPERSFLLTFDDGAKESYYPADPILAALGMNAVSFLLPQYSDELGTHYYLAEGEVEAMLRSGRWQIGSHGKNSHEIVPISDGDEQGAYLANRIWVPSEGRLESDDEYKGRVMRDLAESKADLEERFGISVYSFAFPFGEFGHLSANYPEAESIVRRIAEHIYDVAFYQTWVGEGFSFNYPRPIFEGMIFGKRIEPKPGTAADELLRAFENGLPKSLPFGDDFSKERGWFSVWGAYRHTDGALSLQALPEQTGNAVVLDGSGDWKDYRVRATVRSLHGTGVFLWVRFEDNENNAGCNFGNGFLHAEEVVNGVRNVNAGKRGDIVIPDGDFTVEARVQGRTLTCVLNGQSSVTTEFLNPSLGAGGIGFKAWETQPGSAALSVINVAVEPL